MIDEFSSSRSDETMAEMRRLTSVDAGDYEFYGKDNLVRICDLYGWDSSQWDDGRRVNN